MKTYENKTVTLSLANLLFEKYQEGRKAGIKEVVDWLRNEGIDNDEFNTSEQYPLVHFRLNKEEWQAKLKSWGL